MVRRGGGEHNIPPPGSAIHYQTNPRLEDPILSTLDGQGLSEHPFRTRVRAALATAFSAPGFEDQGR